VSEHFEIATYQTLIEGARLDIETSDDIADPTAQDIFLESLELEID
jgi:hydrogenase nickel incorporation protein HypA/HybF